MTISEMHIGIDLLLQRLNSEIDADIEPKEKDYFINLTTKLLIKAILINEKNSIEPYISREDINRYYNSLRVFINEYNLDLYNYGKYYSGKIPVTDGYNNSIKSGLLIDGVTYRIKTKGNTDLSNFGYDKSSDTFKCNTKLVNNISTLGVGTYKIINPGNLLLDNTAVIYNNIEPESIFIITGTNTSTSDSNTLIKPLKISPVWDDTTELEIVKDINYYEGIGVTSFVSNDKIVNSNNIVIGNTYVVNKDNIDISAIYNYNILNANKGMIFKTISNTINTINDEDLLELDEVDCRLPLDREINNYLHNSFGNIKTNPLFTYYDDEIRIYTNNKFKIYKAILKYIITPKDVDVENSINSPLPESMHEFLLELVVKKIASTINSPDYQYIRNDIIDNNKIVE